MALSKKLRASISDDKLSKKVDDLTIGELKQVIEASGISRIIPWLPEKKKYEVEMPPIDRDPPSVPQPFPEKKKYELEVPPEFFNLEDRTVEDALEYVVNEWKKAAIEVEDLAEQIAIGEEAHFERLAAAIKSKRFR